MDVKTEGARNLGFLLSEGNGNISRETRIIASGSGKLMAGTVLGRRDLGDATAVAKSGGNTGNGTVSAVTIAAGAKSGVYKVEFTAATKFSVTDPEGFQISTGSTGSAFSDDVGFTITAGGTAFVAGDGFDITVAAGTGKWVPSAATATDGSQIARAVLAYAVDATSADAEAVTVERVAEVKKPMLIFHSSIDSDAKVATKITQLASASIIAR